MKTKRVMIFLLCLGVFISGIFLLIDLSKNSPVVLYKGSVLFDSNQEYNAFKDYLQEPEVRIEEVQVVSSEPPIWVRYEIEVPRSWVFPFDYDTTSSVLEGGAIIFILMMVLGAAFAVAIVPWTFAKEEGLERR